jgi:hypothetical protein
VAPPKTANGLYEKFHRLGQDWSDWQNLGGDLR